MIRPIYKNDIPALKNVLDNCELFPREYLDDMIADYFDNSETEHIWFTYEDEGGVVSIAYCAPMELANGTYNLYAIGIHQDYQHKGIGSKMMAHIESLLKDAGHRILIVETSSSPDQDVARKFYKGCGYNHEATIRDFWDDGEDKIVFWKRLQSV